MLKMLLGLLARDDGHAQTAFGPIIPAVGAVLLGIGAAGDDMGWLAIVGGIVLALGLFAIPLAEHATIQKEMYGRLDELEKK